MRDALEASVVKWMGDCDQPMRWGHDDCALSFANVVSDALGYDPGERWRGTYSTREEAYKAVGAGLGFAFRYLAKRHGWKRIDPSEAEVGDPALWMMPIEGGMAMSATLISRGRGSGLWLARDSFGFAAFPERGLNIRLAWSLG